MSQDDASAMDTYERTVRAWVATPDSAKRNRIFEANHQAFKKIRESPEGQQLIRRLAQDANPTASALSATHCLYFDPEYGRPILERLVQDQGEAGFAAYYTLREHDKGTLNLDW